MNFILLQKEYFSFSFTFTVLTSILIYHSLLHRMYFCTNGSKCCTNGLQWQHDLGGKHAFFMLAVHKATVLFGNPVHTHQPEPMGGGIL